MDRTSTNKLVGADDDDDIKCVYHKMNNPVPVDKRKWDDVEKIRAQGKVSKKQKFKKRRWNESVLTQFSLNSQIITCFTDNSFVDKLLPSKPFHNVISQWHGKKENVSELKIKHFFDVFDKDVEQYSQSTSTETLVTSSNPSPYKPSQSVDKIYSNTSPTSTNFSVVAPIMADILVPDTAGCSSIQPDREISDKNTDSHCLSFEIIDPSRSFALDFIGFETPSGSYINSAPSSYEKTGQHPETFDFDRTRIDVPRSIKADDYSLVQTIRKSGTEITNSGSYSLPNATECNSKRPEHCELKTGIGEVTSTTSHHLDEFQSSLGLLEKNSTKPRSREQVIQVVETSPRISIEPINFESQNLAVVPFDNVSSSDDSSEGSRPRGEQTYPSDWQVICNEEYTVLPAVDQSAFGEDTNLPPRTQITSYTALRGQIKDTHSKGSFVPLKSKGVRFVSEMKVVLERNSTADQMAVRHSCRGPCDTFESEIKVKTPLASDSLLCLLCNVPFSSFQDLVSHIDGHKAEKLFLCYYCQKQFCSVYVRNRHMRIHTCGKPFICPICKKSFTRLENMKNHQYLHNNVKKFYKICGKYSSRKPILRLQSHGPSGDIFEEPDVIRKSTPGSITDMHHHLHSEQLPSETELSRSVSVDSSMQHQPCFSEPLNKTRILNCMEVSSLCNEKSFSCAFCPKTFSSIRGMRIHSKMVHVRATKIKAASPAT